eukprot:scaffold26100_cov120-Isochrysis_galbana.AAC.5
MRTEAWKDRPASRSPGGADGSCSEAWRRRACAEPVRWRPSGWPSSAASGRQAARRVELAVPGPEKKKRLGQ